jgi:hypothetical protein
MHADIVAGKYGALSNYRREGQLKQKRWLGEVKTYKVYRYEGQSASRVRVVQEVVEEAQRVYEQKHLRLNTLARITFSVRIAMRRSSMQTHVQCEASDRSAVAQPATSSPASS